MTQSSDVLTVGEVSRLMHVTPHSIYLWLEKGLLPAAKFSGVWRVHRNVVENALMGKTTRGGLGYVTSNDQASTFTKLMEQDPGLTERLVEAIRVDIAPSVRDNLGVSSYNLKHFYESDLGSYIDHGLMKGVLLRVGLRLAQGSEVSDLNWRLRARWRSRYNAMNRYYMMGRLGHFKPRTGSDIPSLPISFGAWLRLCVPDHAVAEACEIGAFAKEWAGWFDEGNQPRNTRELDKVLDRHGASEADRRRGYLALDGYIRFRQVCWPGRWRGGVL